jgi:DNA-directed RNA polymerase specialized sigma24 family protein
LAHLRTLKPRRYCQSLFAYFKTVLLNQVRDHVRRTMRRPVGDMQDPEAHGGASPFEQILVQEVLERYWRGLSSLTAEEQDIVVAVVELGCSDEDLVELFEKPSKNAARMARRRALAHLGRAMEISDGQRR